MDKQGEKFTFRQRWFPSGEDCTEFVGLAEEKHDKKYEKAINEYHKKTREEYYKRDNKSMNWDKRWDFDDSTHFWMSLIGRWARSLILAGALIYGSYEGIGNNVEYSKGERVGVINKISKKGLIWKTKEGQLSLEGRTSTGDYTGAGVWDFSIDRLSKNNKELYSKIEKMMEEGKRVKISYKEPLAVWPWRASTKYLIQNIESLETKK